MKRRAITVTLVVGGLAAGLLAGCATGDKKMMMGSGDIVADRQRIMKLNGASWADAQAKVKAGNFEAVAVNAETMALNAEHIPMLFPKGSLTDKSKAKIKAGNFEAVAVNAETMALNAEHIPMLFPKGSLTDKSKAKPEVWEKWNEFTAAAKTFQTESEKLRDAARAKNQAQVEALAKDFGRNACGTCHTPFRVPPPRQG